MLQKIGVIGVLTVVLCLWCGQSQAQVQNVLSLDADSAPAGATATLELSLNNAEAVGGLQADVVFDSEVAVFQSLSLSGRGTGMVTDSRVVEPGRLRLVLYFNDATSLPAGDGALATLDFLLTGDEDDQTSLLFEDLVVSDGEGSALSGAGAAGQLTVLAPEDPPTLTLAAFKNPGRTTTVSVLVTVIGGSGSLPTVISGGTALTMTDLGGGLFEGQIFAADNATSLSLSASDTNSHGTGNAQLVMALP